jgi:hypothetical protein
MREAVHVSVDVVVVAVAEVPVAANSEAKAQKGALVVFMVSRYW